jgi:hypothetical protein
MKKITILFGRDGSSKVEAHGFSGKACTDATKAIEMAIGKLAGAREEKAEMRGINKALVRQ